MKRLTLLPLLLLVSCSTPDPRTTVERAIQAHGGDVLRNAEVSFRFRGQRYVLRRKGGRFSYVHIHTDTTGAEIRDSLTNDGLVRTRDGFPIPLDDRTYRSAETQVNSVAYFALLPFPLGDPAVQLRALPDEQIRGEPYRTVEVTFSPEGGGRDYEDRFVYWFHRDRHTMDYLAYVFHTGEGGTRFRVAFNPRVVGGVRFADYLNYEAPEVGAEIERYPAMLGSERLRLVTEVRLDSVTVRSLEP